MKKSGIITVIVILCLVLVYLLFVDKQGRRSYQAYVALNGSSITGEPWDGPDAVVVYRTGHNNVICYEAFHSQILHDHLSAKNGQPVVVEYDTFSDFGKIRGYNVHSIDSLIIANGYHLLRPEFAGISGAAGKGAGSIGRDDCW